MSSLNIHELRETPRPDLTIFYVLDRSGSMTGERDQVLDIAMENTINALRQVRSTDSHLRIAVLEYDSGVRWLTPYPEYIEDFVWHGIAKNRYTKKPGELSAPSGLTNMPGALRELNSKMSKNEFLNLKMGSYMPIVIFMTDGYINDAFMPQLNPALEGLSNNRWYKGAIKIGFAIGDGDKDTVIRIVGKEGYTDTFDLQDFANKLVKVSVTASLISGSSRVAPEGISDAITEPASTSGSVWSQDSDGGFSWDSQDWGSSETMVLSDLDPWGNSDGNDPFDPSGATTIQDPFIGQGGW